MNDLFDTVWSTRTVGGMDDGVHDLELFMTRNSKWMAEAPTSGSETVTLARNSLFMSEKTVMFFGCPTRVFG
ncbi:MAG: hypothetical protein AUI93_03650 [Crenarchaeota archaeon 13_1_40CM_3_52_10]|nr:MAG: hypothetical protein AUI93_03650 [Crenarchaeota archaeon 13_1_40CM_3_52_10]